MEAFMARLKIEGMTCKHCVMLVEKTLSGVPGVEVPIQVSLEKGEASFQGQPDLGQVIAALEGEDFKATVIE
jgi:copper chaperone CopZ